MTSLVGGSSFLVSVLPVLSALMLDGESVRIDVWLVAVVISWIRRPSRKKSTARDDTLH